jgi:CRP-like cAMP-binding protein
MDKFIEYIKFYIFLSKDAEKAIREIVKIEKFPKNHIILNEGNTCKRQYFILKGTARTYFYKRGRDITTWIYPEDYLFTSWYSYFLNEPAKEYLETTEDSTILSISKDTWVNLYKNFPDLERFGRLVMEEQIALTDDFYKGYYFLSAKEKYDLLLDIFPNVVLRSNLGHIASMLGISQETLSRIRGK